MRKTYLFLLLILTTTSFSFGQVTCGGIATPDEWYFDGAPTSPGCFLRIDTVSHHHNSWQIASPHKRVINRAYSSPNVIITDSVHPYPPNDTSVFLFKQIDYGGFALSHQAELAGFYRADTDSLHDNGTIEISLNRGTTWVNLVSDTVYTDYYTWLTPKPVLTGKSKGWQNFLVSLARLGQVFHVNQGDTILYRFTFISDPVADTLDGLAFDNFQFCDGSEGIEENPDNNLISIYPNPTNDILYITRRVQTKKESIQIFSYTGQLMFEDDNFKSETVDTKGLNLGNGLYFLKYSNTKSFARKKFIVQH